jgi:hypothetical protein
MERDPSRRRAKIFATAKASNHPLKSGVFFLSSALFFSFIGVVKILDLHRMIGESCDKLQLTAHRFNEAAKSADIHIGALLDLGDRALPNLKCLPDFFL